MSPDFSPDRRGRSRLKRGQDLKSFRYERFNVAQPIADSGENQDGDTKRHQVLPVG
jgi:hypothetical protein